MVYTVAGQVVAGAKPGLAGPDNDDFRSAHCFVSPLRPRPRMLYAGYRPRWSFHVPGGLVAEAQFEKASLRLRSAADLHAQTHMVSAVFAPVAEFVDKRAHQNQTEAVDDRFLQNRVGARLEY